MVSAMPGQHDELELGGRRGAGAAEQRADEGARQGDQAGGLGLVERGQQGLPDRLPADLLVRLRRRGAEREPRLDLVACGRAAPRRKLRPASVAAVIELPMMMPPTATR